MSQPSRNQADSPSRGAPPPVGTYGDPVFGLRRRPASGRSFEYQSPRQDRPHGRSASGGITGGASGTRQSPIAVDDSTPERSPRATGRVPFEQTYEARRSQMLDSMVSGTGLGGYPAAQQSPPGLYNSPRGPQGLLSQAGSSDQATGEQKKYPVPGIGMLDRQEMFDRGLIIPHPPEGPPLDESYNAGSNPPVTVDISTIAFFGITLQELIFVSTCQQNTFTHRIGTCSPQD